MSDVTKLIEGCEKKVRNYMINYARRKGFGEDTVDDALQNAKIRAYRKIDQYDAEMSFTNWFFRIAINSLIDQIKKDFDGRFTASIEHLTEVCGDMFLPEEETSQENELLRDIQDQEEVALALKIINDLPKNLREPLYMLLVENKSYKQISDELGVGVDALRVRVCRAKKTAQKMAEKHLSASV